MSHGKTLTRDARHHRGEVLRDVVAEANTRRDGILPLDLPGVTDAFGDELSLVAALQLRWHTRLAGGIERSLVDQPSDPESAVLAAWRETAAELDGVHRILDRYYEQPTSPEMERALRVARHKDWTLLAAMAGRAPVDDEQAAPVGRALEELARAGYRPAMPPVPARHRADDGRPCHGSVLRRIRAALAA